jgi:cellulose biosynthesis protein BcsQ
LIPTKLDMASARAAVQFVKQVRTLITERVCPHLKIVGVVGAIYRGGLGAEPGAMDYLRRQLGELSSGVAQPDKVKLLEEKFFFPQTVAYQRDAEDGIAYFVMDNSDSSQRAREAVAGLASPSQKPRQVFLADVVR